MEITGKVIVILPMRSGTSKSTGKEWQSQEYVVETDEQYPKHVCFSIFGNDKISQFGIKGGELLTVLFDIDAHEYQGRWYNSIKAWDIKREGNNQPQQQVKQTQVNNVVPPVEESDDLPF